MESDLFKLLFGLVALLFSFLKVAECANVCLCGTGEYCCEDGCCEAIPGISAATWGYISAGITAFVIIIVVVGVCCCIRHRRRNRQQQGQVVVKYPQPQMGVVRQVPEGHTVNGMAPWNSTTATGGGHILTASSKPGVYTTQQQQQQQQQPVKSSAFAYNGSYRMDHHYYNNAHSPAKPKGIKSNFSL